HESYPPGDYPRSMEILRNFSPSASHVFGGPWPLPADRDTVRPDPERATLVQLFRRCFPVFLRPRSLVLSVHDSPYYVAQLTAPERADYRFCHAMMARVLEAGGFAALDVGGDFAAADYLDRCHLSEEGGRKLARRVAPKL